MAKRFTRFFSVPVDEDLVIEVEFGLTKGLPVPFPFVVRPKTLSAGVCGFQSSVLSSVTRHSSLFTRHFTMAMR
jgi:hypothetical protein